MRQAPPPVSRLELRGRALDRGCWAVALWSVTEVLDGNGRLVICALLLDGRCQLRSVDPRPGDGLTGRQSPVAFPAVLTCQPPGPRVAWPRRIRPLS